MSQVGSLRRAFIAASIGLLVAVSVQPRSAASAGSESDYASSYDVVNEILLNWLIADWADWASELPLPTIVDNCYEIYEAAITIYQGNCNDGLTALLAVGLKSIANALVPGVAISWADAVIQCVSTLHGVDESLEAGLAKLMEGTGLAESLCRRFRNVYQRAAESIDWEDWFTPATARDAAATLVRVVREEFEGALDDVRDALEWVLDIVLYYCHQPDAAVVRRGARISGSSSEDARRVLDGDPSTGWEARAGDWFEVEFDKPVDIGWFCIHVCNCDLRLKTWWFVDGADPIGGYPYATSGWRFSMLWHSRLPTRSIRIEVVEVRGCLCDATLRELSVVGKY